MAGKIDRLFAMEAVIKAAEAERDMLKAECAEDLLEAYERDGTTQRRSKFFGKAAGVLSVAFSKEKPPREVVEYHLADWQAFAGWLDDNPKSYAAYILKNAEDFGRWWLEDTGELPDGISRVSYMTEAVPEAPNGVRLAVKGDAVLDALNLRLVEGVDALMLGEVAGDGDIVQAADGR